MNTRHVIDEEKGIKWFVFYTKVRPWLLFLSLLGGTFANIVTHETFYFHHPLLFVSFGLSMAQVVVSIMTFEKSRGDYLEFANFAPKVLAFEAVAITARGFIEQYCEKGFISALIVAAIIGVLAYFIWYGKMSDYFYDRVKEDTFNWMDELNG